MAYRPTQGLVGVKCAAGTGMVNPEYRCKIVEIPVRQSGCRDTEQEMADMTRSANPFARPATKVS